MAIPALDFGTLVPTVAPAEAQDVAFYWATVTATAPLAIRLDGDTSALAFAPDSLVTAAVLHVGSRVWVQRIGKRVVVLGTTNGIGTVAAVPWTSVTGFSNGWINYGSVFQTAQYRKIGDVVTLRGLIKSGTVGSSAFTLPAGYRPPARLIHHGTTARSSTWTTGAASAGTAHNHTFTITDYAVRITVDTDGTVVPYSTIISEYISLDGVSFSVTA
jgi:hypothetical protein